MAFYDYYDTYGFRPYVSVGARRAQAARDLAKLAKKGRKISPVVIEGRKIAVTFWGEAWCDNLERYSDYQNRLPRGRSYVRNGSVVDLQVAPGKVTAFVSGSTMYTVNVTVAPVPPTRWRDVCRDCSGAIDSLVELLQGQFSKGVMTRLCHEKTGLFPAPKDIVFRCSCPDVASMCKHVAAVLYGIGARLDHQPEMLFTLRKVDQRDLIAKAGADLSKTRKGQAGTKVLESDDLAGMFGIELAPVTPAKRAAPRAITTSSSPAGRPPKASRAAPIAKPPQPKATPPKLERRRVKRFTRAERRAMSAGMRKFWARRRAATTKREAPES